MKRNSYFVDHVEGVIVITSSFAKEAGKYGTEAYKTLKKDGNVISTETISKDVYKRH